MKDQTEDKHFHCRDPVNNSTHWTRNYCDKTLNCLIARGCARGHVGGMCFRSSQTAASAALETMKSGCEENLGSHRRLWYVPTAVTSISSMTMRLRRGSPRYGPARSPRRLPSMESSPLRSGGLGSAASHCFPWRGLIPKSSMGSPSSPSMLQMSSPGTSSLSTP